MENNVNIIMVTPNAHHEDNDTYVYGYKLMTTFWNDFIIAEQFGVNAIKETYKRAFTEWKDNYKYLTELVMVLNWRSWICWKHNDEYMELYSDLYYEADEYACTNLKGEELNYYFITTD